MFKTVVIIFICYIHGLRSDNDFCYKNEKKICTGKYDQSNLKYTEICEKIKCQSPLSNDCKDFCTRQMTNCKFFNWHLRIFEFKPVKNSFQKCLNLTVKNSDFCLNGKKCLRHLIAEPRNLTRKIDCKCPNDKSFICGKYCTTNNIICKAIQTSKKKSKSCGNSNSSYFLKQIAKSYFPIRF